MKKLNFLEKLSKNELKQIKAGDGIAGTEGGTGGGRSSGSGGSSNNGNVGVDVCGLAPEDCYSQEWYTWYYCLFAYNGTAPVTQCQ